MVERVPDSDYCQIQHFISESPWDYRAAIDKVASDPSWYKATGNAIEVRQLAENIAKEAWQKIRLRQAGKGDPMTIGLNCPGYSQKVFLWDGQSPDYMERQLVVRVAESKNGSGEYKYAISYQVRGWLV